MALFEKEWREREANMKKFAGFQGFSIKKDGDKYVTASTWASIPEWEAWSLSEEARRSHLPLVSCGWSSVRLGWVVGWCGSWVQSFGEVRTGWMAGGCRGGCGLAAEVRHMRSDGMAHWQ